MNRRRMMMLQQKKDYLEGCRYSVTPANYTYRLGVQWVADDIVRIYHTQYGFMGPSVAARTIFSASSPTQSTSLKVVMGEIKAPLPYVELNKKYKLTMELIKVDKNTATATNDGTFNIGFGRGSSNYSSMGMKISEMVEGVVFEMKRGPVSDANYLVGGAAFEAENADLLWDFTFKVKVEEVKQ